MFCFSGLCAAASLAKLVVQEFGSGHRKGKNWTSSVLSVHVVRTTSKLWEGRELLKFTKMKNTLAKRAICYFSLRYMEISDVLVTSLAA